MEMQEIARVPDARADQESGEHIRAASGSNRGSPSEEERGKASPNLAAKGRDGAGSAAERENAAKKAD
jgi:hypothetical protein